MMSRRLTAILLLCLAVGAVPTAAATALLHATLLRSTPAAKSRITTSPSVIRLVFSEQVVPELSQISVTGVDGRSISLRVSNDTHDVHVLIGPIDAALAGGPYRVTWRVLSADGHPVAGAFDFTLVGGAGTTALPVSSSTPAVAPGPTSAVPATESPYGTSATSVDAKPVPVFAALVRGLGLGALMAGVGLLFFGLTSREHTHLAAPRIVSRWIAAGAVLLVIHALLWVDHVAPDGRLSGAFVTSLLGSDVGRIELLRTLLAVLALWAIALARHRKLALGLGAACLVVSGGIGHPAAIDPYFSIPAKILHLLAGAAWLGGLIWLVWLARCDDAACRVEARRVSSLALTSVSLIAISGVLQSFFFLNSPADLLHSNYGKLVLAKAAGLAVLVGFGAYNRFRLLPDLEASDGSRKLARSVRWEIVIVTVIILIGGFLAYVPTPPLAASTASAAIKGSSND